MRHPVSFYPELTDERLGFIARELLSVRYDTQREVTSPLDDNHTRETAIFGRSKNRLIQLGRDPAYPWLTLRRASMDVTVAIGRVPFRFFRDDPENPEKTNFFRRNFSDNLFPPNDGEPVMWRMVIEKAESEDDEDRAYFLGFNEFEEKISEWEYRPGVAMLHSTDLSVPDPVELPPLEIDIRTDEDNCESDALRDDLDP